jgi:hypothetical protein
MGNEKPPGLSRGLVLFLKTGGGEGIRTPDFLLAKQALSH